MIYLLFWCLGWYRTMLDVGLKLLITIHEYGGCGELQHQFLTDLLLQEVVGELNLLGIEEVGMLIKYAQ